MDCEYRCQNCKYTFSRKIPGPVTCEKCGHLYIDWVNFKKVIEELKKDEKSGYAR